MYITWVIFFVEGLKTPAILYCSIHNMNYSNFIRHYSSIFKNMLNFISQISV